MDVHTAVAVLGLENEELVRAVLNDWRNAPVSEKIRATLGFLEKITLSPTEVGPQDIALLRAREVSTKAIEEALYVCFLFNLMDRLADSFDFALPSPEGLQKSARDLFERGYKTSSIR